MRGTARHCIAAIGGSQRHSANIRWAAGAAQRARLHACCMPHCLAKLSCVAKASWLPAFVLGLGHTLDVVGEFLRATLG
ncbi:hypothetical protein L2249_20935, partial [Xanthomonas perforans]|nr:hypothetical protein [Xanthomonas perforans]